MNIKDVKKQYYENEEEIDNRLESFRDLKNNGDDKRFFKELVFVILTSQSDAKKSWECTVELSNRDLLEGGEKELIDNVISKYDIQYESKKASYIVKNRGELSQPSLANPGKSLDIKNKISEDHIEKSRKWFVENMEGVSWKGSSHFLRNIGYGFNFAVISRPLLKQMASLGVIESVKPPKNQDEYLRIEEEFRKLADDIDFSCAQLDLTLWSMETGEVFK